METISDSTTDNGRSSKCKVEMRSNEALHLYRVLRLGLFLHQWPEMVSIVKLCLTIARLVHWSRHSRHMYQKEGGSISQARNEMFVVSDVSKPTGEYHNNGHGSGTPRAPGKLKDERAVYPSYEKVRVTKTISSGYSEGTLEMCHATKDRRGIPAESLGGELDTTTVHEKSLAETHSCDSRECTTAETGDIVNSDCETDRHRRLILLAGLERFFRLSHVCTHGKSPCLWREDAICEELQSSLRIVDVPVRRMPSNKASRSYGNVSLSSNASAHLGDIYNSSPGLQASAGSAVLTGVVAGAAAALTNRLTLRQRIRYKSNPPKSTISTQQAADNSSGSGHDDHSQSLMEQVWARAQSPDEHRLEQTCLKESSEATNTVESPIATPRAFVRAPYRSRRQTDPLHVLQTFKSFYEDDLTDDRLALFRRKDDYEALEEVADSRRCLKLTGNISKWPLLARYPALRYVVIFSEHTIEKETLRYLTKEATRRVGVILFDSDRAANEAPRSLSEIHSVRASTISFSELRALFNIGTRSRRLTYTVRSEYNQHSKNYLTPLHMPSCVMPDGKAHEPEFRNIYRDFLVREKSYKKERESKLTDTFPPVRDLEWPARANPRDLMRDY